MIMTAGEKQQTRQGIGFLNNKMEVPTDMPMPKKNEKLSTSEINLHIFNDDHDDDLESASAPALRREQAVLPRLVPSQPGAVRVNGPHHGHADIVVDDTSSIDSCSSESTTGNNDHGPPLVNAELVVPPDEEASPLPMDQLSDTVAASVTHIPAEIFHATPVKLGQTSDARDENLDSLPQLKDLVKNTAVRIILLLLILIIIGLIIGLVVGFMSSGPPTVVYEFEGEDAAAGGTLASFGNHQSFTSSEDD